MKTRKFDMCPTPRRKTIQTGSLVPGQGFKLDREEIRIEECGTPLFGAQRETGLCRACQEGRSVPGNEIVTPLPIASKEAA